MGKICVSFLICEQKKGFLLSTSARMPLCSRSFLEVQLEFKISSVNGKPSTLGRYFFPEAYSHIHLQRMPLSSVGCQR